MARSHQTFDLEVSCKDMSAPALATDLILCAATRPEFRIERGDDENSPVVRFIIVRFTAEVIYGAEFYLDGNRLLAAFVTSPADWTSDKRADAFARAFEPLFSLVVSKAGIGPTVQPASDERPKKA